MYLGLDLSTQQLKAVILGSDQKIKYETNVHFDNDLPEFRTNGGVIKSEVDPKVITAPVLMWVKALDMLLEKLQSNGVDFSKIITISGCAQQHGTVYWSIGSQAKLKHLNPSNLLHEELSCCFSLTYSPTWMDSSTTKECILLEDAVGGATKMAEITGSRAYERFSGPQIAKVARISKNEYSNTERISLVSSFLASIFIGDYAPIDWSDGSGMNLLNIHTKMWDTVLLQACASELKDKLGNPVPSSTKIGSISEYFVKRYKFDKECNVISFTGDNPSTLAGLGLRKGDIVCSLGTSDTLFLWLNKTKNVYNGHILCNPLDKNSYMAMLCFRNGSLTRERISNEFANSSWTKFNEILNNTPRGNYGCLGLYLDTQEVLPPVTGDYRFNEKNEEVDKFNFKNVDIRAVIEGQFMLRRIFAEEFGFSICSDTRIVATGGASANEAILQILADVFNCPVYISETINAAAVGAAYRAKFHSSANLSNYDDLFEKSSELILSCQPNDDAQHIYDPLTERLRIIIQELLLKKDIVSRT